MFQFVANDVLKLFFLLLFRTENLLNNKFKGANFFPFRGYKIHNWVKLELNWATSEQLRRTNVIDVHQIISGTTSSNEFCFFIIFIMKTKSADLDSKFKAKITTRRNKEDEEKHSKLSHAHNIVHVRCVIVLDFWYMYAAVVVVLFSFMIYSLSHCRYSESSESTNRHWQRGSYEHMLDFVWLFFIHIRGSVCAIIYCVFFILILLRFKSCLMKLNQQMEMTES